MCKDHFISFHLDLLDPLADIFKRISRRKLDKHIPCPVHCEDPFLSEPLRYILSEINLCPQIYSEFITDLRRLFADKFQLSAKLLRRFSASSRVMMRSRYDIAYPILIRLLQHLAGLFHTSCPVINFWKYMAMCINQSIHLYSQTPITIYSERRGLSIFYPPPGIF